MSGARALRWGAQRMSDGGVQRRADQLGALAYRVCKREAEIARRQLMAAFPTATEDEARETAKRCFQKLAASALELFKYRQLNSQTIGSVVEAGEAERIREALSAGQGCVLIMAHFGNWELGGAAVALNGVPFWPLGRDLRSPALNRLAVEQRTRYGMRPISRERGLRGVVECLRSNGALGILPDVDTSVEGVFVPFFGKLAYTPVGPYLLSRKYDAPALPVFIERTESGRRSLRVGETIQWKRTGGETQDRIANAAIYTNIIERQIRRQPEQWIWMHERWKRRPETERGAAG